MEIQTLGAQLDSVSLVLDDQALAKGPTLSSILDLDFSRYQLQSTSQAQEFLSPQLWNMPDVFRKKLSAYSEFYFNELNEQDRLAGIVRYNFSNGVQVSAKEILRHPLQKAVPRDLLPQPKKSESLVFSRWALNQRREKIFISQSLIELEEIIQALLNQVITKHRQGQVDLYLQSKVQTSKALKIQTVEFEPRTELYWRVEFSEKEVLETEIKLMSHHKNDFCFYETVAVEPSAGVLLVHPWMRETNQLDENLKKISDEDSEAFYRQNKMPHLDIVGQLETKAILKYLRSRSIPVMISGETHTLSPQQSMTTILLEESGRFQVQHQARVLGQKDFSRPAWTAKSILFLNSLSQGLPYFLNADAKFLASKSRGKRDWDMRLLKHLGILQYVLLEALNYHFEGHLTDGTILEKENIFSHLHSKVQMLLVTGVGGILEKNIPLVDLCSKSVLALFEDFLAKTFVALNSAESFYSESGELIVEGLIEREFRLIFEFLKKLTMVTAGDAFKKSRTSFLSKIWTGDPEKDPQLSQGLFFFPKTDMSITQLQETLESLQGLIPLGFNLYYRGQALQELNEDEFHVDFLLQTDAEEKVFNWFELNPRFFLKGEEIDPKNMGSLGGSGVIEYEGRIYLVPRKQMPSLKKLENFWNKLQQGKNSANAKKSGEKLYQLPRHQVLELLSLRASGVRIRGDHEWQKVCNFYDQLGKNNQALVMPKAVGAKLKPYQALGVQWLQDLYNLKLGALLADDMGLGKTLQTLSFLEGLREKNDLGPVLIVVPSSLIYNWQSEIEKFTPDLPLVVFTSRERESIAKRVEAQETVLVIATYGLLMEHGDFLSQYKWKVLIFDEAQNLKNITTKRTSAARSLSAQFKVCLTGTPMENHYGEFYSLVDIVVPGSLGKIDDFRRQFVNTETVSREEMEDLKLKIRPLLMRRTKREILDQLPEKQETKVSIAFEERQKEIYRDIALSYNQKVQESVLSKEKEGSVQLQMLTALLRLRQACSDPGALPNVRYDKVPPKIEALLDSIREIVESGESALVFTQFLQTLEHTVSKLKACGIPVFVLHGGVPARQRQKTLADFNQTPGGAVLVMTLKTGGVGLNLTKASYVFHLEPWWNPSVENQATDRAHRLGQNKAVQVFKYIMHESLEEKIELLKKRKDQKFQTLFGNEEKEIELGVGGSALSREDFDLLLGLK